MQKYRVQIPISHAPAYWNGTCFLSYIFFTLGDSDSIDTRVSMIISVDSMTGVFFSDPVYSHARIYPVSVVHTYSIFMCARLVREREKTTHHISALQAVKLTKINIPYVHRASTYYYVFIYEKAKIVSRWKSWFRSIFPPGCSYFRSIHYCFRFTRYPDEGNTQKRTFVGHANRVTQSLLSGTSSFLLLQVRACLQRVWAMFVPLNSW